MSKEQKSKLDNKNKNKQSNKTSAFSKRTKILLGLFVFFIVGYILIETFSKDKVDTDSQPTTPEEEIVLDPSDLTTLAQFRDTYVRPDYATLDFYTALGNLGYEMNFLFEDLKEYYAKGDAMGKTLEDLKADRHFILETLDTAVEKEMQVPNSVLVGESVELLYTFDEAMHNLEQVINLIENDKKQLTTYNYNQAKEKIQSFEQVVEYLILLQEEENKAKENNTAKETTENTE